MRSGKVIAIVGPTATGKSDLAIRIAQKIPAEIISADSMQVYKGMDIGTAKVSLKLRKKIKHHLIDIVSIKESFNAVKYQQLARAAIEDIIKRSNHPIIAGGTGLYIRAALYKLNFGEHAQNTELRQRLEAQLKGKGLKYLQEKLREKDLAAHESIDLNNSRRLIRALEVIETTGKPFSYFREDWHNWQLFYDAIFIGLTMPREVLYERINKRVDQMMEAGLLEETKRLVGQSLREAIIAKQALGYKELIEYLDSNVTLEQAIEILKQKTRKYAKRQYTWFKKDPNVKWHDISKTSMQEIVEQIMDLLNPK